MEQIETDEDIKLFWRRYYNSDSIDRFKMVEKLLNNADFFKLAESAKVPPTTKKHCIITLINNYLEDYTDFIRTETNK